MYAFITGAGWATPSVNEMLQIGGAGTSTTPH
jgi:hypothetical protein